MLKKIAYAVAIACAGSLLLLQALRLDHTQFATVFLMTTAACLFYGQTVGKLPAGTRNAENVGFILRKSGQSSSASSDEGGI